MLYKLFMVHVMLTQAFSKLPDTLDEIDAMLNEEHSRAEGFIGLSESVRITSAECFTNSIMFILRRQLEVFLSLEIMEEIQIIFIHDWQHLPNWSICKVMR